MRTRMSLLSPLLVGYQFRKGVKFGFLGVFARMSTIEPFVHIYSCALLTKR